MIRGEFRKGTPSQARLVPAVFRACFIKYSNGGCSGLEPDFLFIYSVHNFSNRIF